jgi:hypothetical protein
LQARELGHTEESITAMDYTLEFANGRVTITTSRQADVGGVLRLVEELVSDPRFTPGLPILADHRALDTRSLTAVDARRIGEIFVELGDRIGNSPLAVVVSDALTYGLTRIATAQAARAPLKAALFYTSRRQRRGSLGRRVAVPGRQQMTSSTPEARRR